MPASPSRRVRVQTQKARESAQALRSSITKRTSPKEAPSREDMAINAYKDEIRTMYTNGAMYKDIVNSLILAHSLNPADLTVTQVKNKIARDIKKGYIKARKISGSAALPKPSPNLVNRTASVRFPGESDDSDSDISAARAQGSDGQDTESSVDKFMELGRLYKIENSQDSLICWVKLFPGEKLKAVRFNEEEFALELIIPPPNDSIVKGAFDIRAGQAAFVERVASLVLVPATGKFDTSKHPKTTWLNYYGRARTASDVGSTSPSWAVIKVYFGMKNTMMNNVK